ncbi:hypothetical protein [Radiobacillus deserti]|uniref:Uncharacterized protein n=1 Tax=Radiobacillus deserti TaxID=2594883 RepID=A0A516KJP1_9BACI|nr:hypothetical protein [Radiobacillus deserti]QDP41606.1 hypothetical protein FN924_16375 [Radiobacillus deserti]
MTHKRRKIIIVVVGIWVFSVLIITLVYPYSFVSVHKSYTFTPDPVVVEQYVNDLEEFKSSYKKDLDELTRPSNDDVTMDRTQFLLPLFAQDWLVSKQPVKMSVDDLETILFEVKNARNSLLELMAKKDYTQEQRQYLVDSIDHLLSLEEEIDRIKNGGFVSRKTLNVQFVNLHGSFLSNFMIFKIFYDTVQIG